MKEIIEKLITWSLILYIYFCVSYTFLIYVDSLLDIFLQPTGIDQNTVERRQNIICLISVLPDVDPDTIELGWLNEDDIIIDDSRVTINTSSDYYNDSTLVTIIQFNPLIEDDMGEYICYAVINGSLIFKSVYLQDFTSKLYIN